MFIRFLSVGTVTAFTLACTGGGGDKTTVVVEDVPPVVTVEEAPPEPPPPVKAEDGWMVVAASNKDKARVEALFAEYQSKGLPAHGDFPKLMSSDGIEGLKPGFWLVVAAISSDSPTARAIEMGLEEMGETNAYIREVNMVGVEHGLNVEAVLTPPAYIAHWVPGDGGCRWQLIDPVQKGKRVRTLAELDEKCADYQLSAGEAGKFLIQMGNGLFETNTHTGATRRLPTPGNGQVDGVAFLKGGGIRAYTTEGEYDEDREAEKAWFTYDGKRIDVEFDEYVMEWMLCTSWELKGDKWVFHDQKAEGYGEGSGAPFCTGGDDENPVVSPTDSGGHGVMLSEDFGDAAEDLPDFMKIEDVTLGLLSIGPGDGMACHVDWLEGEFYSPPAFLHVEDEGWVPLEGLQEGGNLNFSVRDDLLLACTHAEGGVYDLKNGKRIWTSEGSCPAWWIGIGGRE
jgi:hypothetical protein